MIEIKIREHTIKDFIKKNGYNITDFDDVKDKCVRVYDIVDVNSGDEGCYVGCLMESGKYWVVGCRIDRQVESYDEMVKYLKDGI